MKKRARLLSILSAAVIGATMCFTACGEKEVSEHDHIWNDGEVTTQPTCHTEGIKTFTCTVEGCGRTKTMPVAMTEHSWNEGEVTKEPKCNEKGEKTFKCTNVGCTATRVDDVEKTAHHWDGGVVTTVPDFYNKGVLTKNCADCGSKDTQSIAACADFENQYYGEATAANDWKYGSAAFDESAGTVDFTAATLSEGKWTAEGIEIAKGTVSIENGKTAAIGYQFVAPREEVQTDVNISFVNDGENAVKAYLVYPESGAQTANLNPDGEKDFKYESEEPIDLEEGTYYIILVNDSGAKASGKLTFTLTPPCVHVWDDGEVTAEPTCHSVGVKTYHCINADCEVTRTETLPQNNNHNWGDGEVQTPATKLLPGVMKYECQNEGCSEIKTEAIPKLGSIVFGKDFEINETGEFSNWSVGVVNYTYEEETFTFEKITAKNDADDAYKVDSNGIKEVKGDWMSVNGMMGFAYKFVAAGDYFVDFHLQAFKDDKLETENGDFSLRWAVKNSTGEIKNANGKAEWGGSANTLDFLKSISVDVDDTLYLLVNKEEGGNTDQCKFDIAICPELADFGKDFAKTLAGEDTGWGVNNIDFKWEEGPDKDTFTATRVTNKNGAQDGFMGDPFAEVKGGWMASEAMVGLSYTSVEAMQVKFNVTVNCLGDDGKCSIRWAIIDSNNTIKTNDGKIDWGGDGKDVTLIRDITLEEGDTLYILVNYEDTIEGDDKSNDQKDFKFTIF